MSSYCGGNLPYVTRYFLDGLVGLGETYRGLAAPAAGDGLGGDLERSSSSRLSKGVETYSSSSNNSRWTSGRPRGDKHQDQLNRAKSGRTGKQGQVKV